MKRYLAILMVAVLLLAMLPVTSMAATQYANVVGGWLRLRSAPNFNAETLNSYYTGTQVKILSSSGGWYRVETPDGSKGYMYGQYLRLGSSSSGSGSGSTGTGNAYVTSHNGYGVRLRTGPGTGYRVIRKYDVGTPVTVLERGNYWSKIEIRGTVGYMMSQFLNFGSSPTPGGDSVVCYATVHSSNGYGVRLRTGPSKSYSKIGVYSVGTVVAVLEKGAVWDRIRVGSRVGWMMNEFLYYYNTNEVTSVTLNNYKPAVGMVLGVQAISPSSATVSYEWLVDGVKAGTSSTYTVGTTDVGKAIQLKVLGTGNYNGTAYSAVTDKVISNTQISAVKLNTVAPVVGNVLSAAITPENATVLYAWKVGGYQVSNAESYTVKSEDAGKKIELIVTGTGNYSGSAMATTAEVAASSGITDVSIVNQTNQTAGVAPMVGDILVAATSPAQATVSYQWILGTTPILNATQSTYQIAEGDKGSTLSVTVTGTGSYTGTKTSTATLPVVEKATKPVITSFTLADAYLDALYSLQLTAQGGGSMTWTIASGTLPTGLVLKENGQITGTPTEKDKYEFSVVAKNSAGSSEEMHFAIEVKAFTLNINGGTGTTTATDLGADAQVPIQAALVTADGKVFSNWTVTMGNAVVADANSANTICTLNASDAEVTAEYREPDDTTATTPDDGADTPATTPDDGADTPATTPDDDGTDTPATTPDDGTDTPATTPDDGTDTPATTPDDGADTPATTPDDDTDTSATTPDDGADTTTTTPEDGENTLTTTTPENGENTQSQTSDGGETENQTSDVGGAENQIPEESDSNSVSQDSTLPENSIPTDAASVNNYVDENPEINDEVLPSSDAGQEPLQMFMADPAVDSEPNTETESVEEPEPENPTSLQWESDGCSASWNGESGQTYHFCLVSANGETLQEGSTSECFYSFNQMVEPGCVLKVRIEGNSNWVKLSK